MSYLNTPTSVLTYRRILVYRQPSEVPVVVLIFLVLVAARMKN